MLLSGVTVALLTACGDSVSGGAETTVTRKAEQLAIECPETSPERSGAELRNIHIALDGHYGPENIGVLMAAEHGYFKDEGVKARITSTATPGRSLDYVTGGIVDFGVSHEPQLVMSQGSKPPLIAVGSLIPQPTAAMIWLEKSQIDGLADLKGKVIAIPGIRFQKEFLLQSLLAKAELTLEDVEVKRLGYDLVPALVHGQVDAIFGGSWNVEGVELESRGLRPVITRVQALGTPSYSELVLLVRRGLVSRKPQVVRDVMSAVVRGTAAAVEDPQDAVELIEKSDEADPEVGGKTIEAQVEATLPLLSRTGYMSSAQASHLVSWMHDEWIIQRRPPVSSLITNSCLPRRS